MILKVKSQSGAGRGEGLGYPTLNFDFLSPSKKVVQASFEYGVYAGKLYLGDQEFIVAINWGSRPTFHETEPVMEAFILDFDEDLFRNFLEFELELLERIRDIHQFSSKKELISQIEKDVKLVREICSR